MIEHVCEWTIARSSEQRDDDEEKAYAKLGSETGSGRRLEEGRVDAIAEAR
jgi:hypothetical protein